MVNLAHKTMILIIDGKFYTESIMKGEVNKTGINDDLAIGSLTKRVFR